MDSLSQPILKKSSAIIHNGGDHSTDSSHFSKDQGKEADDIAFEKQELQAFLTKKNLHLVEDVEVKCRKTKKMDSSMFADQKDYSVQYLMKDGSIVSSRNEVVKHLQEVAKKQNSSRAKEDKFAAAKANAVGLLQQLPCDMDGIYVHKIGEIDSEMDSFWCENQIFPVGLCTEVKVPFKDGLRHTVKVSVAVGDNRKLSLLAEVKEIGAESGSVDVASVSAESETELHDQVEEAIGARHESKEDFEARTSSLLPASFLFNLAIELLIEGLPGASRCHKYKCHADRGYGRLYVSGEQYVEHKRAMQARASKERRASSGRQIKPTIQTVAVDYAEEKRLAALKRTEKMEKKKRLKLKKKAEEDAARKAVEEEAKAKKQKEKQKEQTKTQSQFKAAPRTGEAKKWLDELKAQFKKDTLAEVKKARAEALLALLSVVDEEADAAEEERLQLQALWGGENEVGRDRDSNLVAFLGSLSDLSAHCESSGADGASADMWNNLLQVVNRLHTFRDFLKLHVPLDLNGFLKMLDSVDAVSEKTDGAGSMQTDDSSAMSVSEDAAVAQEAESDVHKRAHMQTRVDFDRLQLCTVRGIYSTLHQVLDLVTTASGEFAGDGETEHSYSLSGHGGGDVNRYYDGSVIGHGSVHFPLNTLTWRELARMSLVTVLASELGTGGGTGSADVNGVVPDKRDEIAHLLKGSRLSGYRSTRNVLRLLRWRMAVRSIPCTPMSSLLVKSLHTDAKSPGSNCQISGTSEEGRAGTEQTALGAARVYSFDSVDEILRALVKMTTGTGTVSAAGGDMEVEGEGETEGTVYPESYRRCARVLIKLLNLPVAEPFVWEVDSAVYPEYYETIARPMAFCIIADKLLTKAYGGEAAAAGDGDRAAYLSVCRAFYVDVHLLGANCLVYNTESVREVASVYKIMAAARRHMQQWVFGETVPNSAEAGGSVLPPLDACDELHCFYSLEPIDQAQMKASSIINSSTASSTEGVVAATIASGSLTLTSRPQSALNVIKCSICSAVFSSDAMQRSNPVAGSVVDSTKHRQLTELEKVRTYFESVVPSACGKSSSGVNADEWYCCYCLLEDSAEEFCAGDRESGAPQLNAAVDAAVPWLFNAQYSERAATEFGRDGLNNSRVCDDDSGMQKLEDQFISGNSHNIQSNSPAMLSMLNALKILTAQGKGSATGVESVERSLERKVNMFAGLTEVMLTQPATQAKLARTNALHGKLLRAVLYQGPFRVSAEGRHTQFLDLVKSISGRNGLRLCSLLLGKCKGDKIEGSLEESVRQWGLEKGDRLLEDVDQFRDRDIEEVLVERNIVRKWLAQGGSSSAAPAGAIGPAPSTSRCEFCGLSELDVCSPLVVGQHRSEHECSLQRVGGPLAVLPADVPGYPVVCVPGAEVPSVKVTFSSRRADFPVPKLALPYLPYFGNGSGDPTQCRGAKALRNKFFAGAYSDQNSDGNSSSEGPKSVLIPKSPVVHETCALHMFKHRMDAAKANYVRRTKRLIAERIVGCGGIGGSGGGSFNSSQDQASGGCIQLLGLDDSSREYWMMSRTHEADVANATTPAEKAYFDIIISYSSDEGVMWKHTSSRKELRELLLLLSVHSMPADSDPAVRSKQLSIASLLDRGSSNERALRRKLHSVLLIADKQAEDDEARCELEKMSAAASASATEVAVVVTAESTPADTDVMEVEVSATATSAAASPAKDVEQPVRPRLEMKLVREKSTEIQPVVTIAQEVGFEEWEEPEEEEVPEKKRPGKKAKDEEEEEEDVAEEKLDLSYQEYFKFTRSGKYYGIGFYGDDGKKIRVNASDNLLVTYQIHRLGNLDSCDSSAGEGEETGAEDMEEIRTMVANSQPLAFSPLAEPWSDGVYYFSTLSFKKSGHYAISFHVDEIPSTSSYYTAPPNPNAEQGRKSANSRSNVVVAPAPKLDISNLKPIVFHVKVVAKSIICGIPAALATLNATPSVYSGYNRAIQRDRRELSNILDSCAQSVASASELDAAKYILLSIYAALPQGSLMFTPTEPPAAANCYQSGADTLGWNDLWDQRWRDSVVSASTPLALLECTLLLESCIHKHAFHSLTSNSGPCIKLLAALPAPHFALRNPSVSAVALRLYCLDRCIMYNKTHKRVDSDQAGSTATGSSSSQDRNSRTKAAPAAATVTSSSGRVIQQRVGANPSGRSVSVYAELDENDYANVISDRPKRGAAISAASRITNMSNELNEEREGRSSRDSGRSSHAAEHAPEQQTQRAASWTCGACSTENSARARTCDVCGTKKPAFGATQMASSSSSSSSSRKRVVEDEEEGGEEEEPVKRARHSEGEVVPERPDFPTLLSNVAAELVEYCGSDLRRELGLVQCYLTVLRDLSLNMKSDPFWSPVTDDVAPDYGQYIKDPMDLGTVTSRVTDRQYSNKAAFISDVELVFSNCIAYNSDESLIGQYARSLQSAFHVSWNQVYARFNKKPQVNATELKREQDARSVATEDLCADGQGSESGDIGKPDSNDEEEEEETEMTAPAVHDGDGGDGSSSDEDASEMDEDSDDSDDASDDSSEY